MIASSWFLVLLGHPVFALDMVLGWEPPEAPLVSIEYRDVEIGVKPMVCIVDDKNKNLCVSMDVLSVSLDVVRAEVSMYVGCLDNCRPRHLQGVLTIQSSRAGGSRVEAGQVRIGGALSGPWSAEIETLPPRE